MASIIFFELFNAPCHKSTSLPLTIELSMSRLSIVETLKWHQYELVLFTVGNEKVKSIGMNQSVALMFSFLHCKFLLKRYFVCLIYGGFVNNRYTFEHYVKRLSNCARDSSDLWIQYECMKVRAEVCIGMIGRHIEYIQTCLFRKSFNYLIKYNCLSIHVTLQSYYIIN